MYIIYIYIFFFSFDSDWLEFWDISDSYKCFWLRIIFLGVECRSWNHVHWSVQLGKLTWLVRWLWQILVGSSAVPFSRPLNGWLQNCSCCLFLAKKVEACKWYASCPQFFWCFGCEVLEILLPDCHCWMVWWKQLRRRWSMLGMGADRLTGRLHLTTFEWCKSLAWCHSIFFQHVNSNQWNFTCWFLLV